MKINMIKQAGGALLPASELEAEKLKKFKNNEMYTIELKNSRNPQFHRKVFQFMNFCFEHWISDNEYLNEQGQLDVMRDNMTVLTGAYKKYYNLNGEVRIEADSWAFASMTQEEFEKLYNALIQVAMHKIFVTNDQEVYNKLASFF